MKREMFLFGALFFTLSISGCDWVDIVDAKEQLKQLKAVLSEQKKELADLNQSLRAINAKNLLIESRIAELEALTSALKSRMAYFEDVEFDPSSTSFQRVDAYLAAFAVSIQDVRPHADGVKVRLHIGNLSTASFNGGTLRLKWGPRSKANDGKNIWRKEKEFPFAETLGPGAWNNVSFVLPATQPTEFGFLKVGIETKSITLHSEPPKK